MNESEPLTRMTFETLGSKFVIEHAEDCMNIWELTETTIRPLLLAAGFHPNTIAEVLGEPT